MSQLPKICHVTWTGQLGGIERMVVTLAMAQQRQQHEVAVAFGKSGGPIEEELKAAGVPTKVLRLPNGFSVAPAALREATRLFRGFDIVHIHAYNPLLLQAATMSNARVIFTFHSLSHLRSKGTWKDTINRRILNRYLKNSIHAATTVSQFAKEQLTGLFTIPGGLHVVHNCIPSIETAPNTSDLRKILKIKEKELVLLTFGRLVHHKRMEIALETTAKLIRQDIAVKLLIVGDGPHKESLKELSHRLRTTKHVQFLGSQSNIAQYIALADICLFPFEAESFGLVALEAMSLSKPALALPDGGGLTEIIAPINQGEFIVANAEEMRQKILGLRKSSLTEETVKAFQKRVEHYSVEKSLAGYNNLYQG